MSEIVRDYASEKGSSFYLTFNFYFPYFLVSLWTILSILLQKLNCWVEVYLRSLNTTEKLTGRTNLDVFQRRCLALSEEFLWSAKNENQLKPKHLCMFTLFTEMQFLWNPCRELICQKNQYGFQKYFEVSASCIRRVKIHSHVGNFRPRRRLQGLETGKHRGEN